MKDFYAIFKEHDGLVSQRWTHYPFVYDKIFERFCNKDTSLTLLEIGVQNGGGLEIWKKYLPSNSIIHGIDINPKCECLQFSENIYFHLGNATDSAFINSAFKDDTKFDVILDDGSHNSKDVITAFESLFWRLKDGGIYIIEDLEHSYWKNSGGGFRKKKASIEYFKRLVDALNLQHIKGHRKQRMLLEKFNSRISSIYFYSGICVIETYYTPPPPRNIKFETVYTGSIEKVIKISEWRKNKKELEEIMLLNKTMFGGTNDVS